MKKADKDLITEIRSRWFTPAEPKRKTTVWKDAHRGLVGTDGEVIWRGILSIAEGKAWVPQLPDGREGPPQIPTAADRHAAYRYLADALFGRPTSQEKIAEAEKAAAENQDLHALTDDELEAKVRQALMEGSVLGEVVKKEPP